MTTTHTYTPKHTPVPRPDPAHKRPWHREAVYGEGIRRVLSARERDEYGHMLARFEHDGLIPPGTRWTGLALRDHLDWRTGQCDPSHALIGLTVRERYCRKRCNRTVQRDLVRLLAVGAITWEQRLVRCGWRSEQTSNAYCLHPDADGRPRALPVPVQQPARQTVRQAVQQAPLPVRQVQPAPVQSTARTAERGDARVTSADRTAFPSQQYESRRDSGFSAILSAGDGDPVPPAVLMTREAAEAASKARAQAAWAARRGQSPP